MSRIYCAVVRFGFSRKNEEQQRVSNVIGLLKLFPTNKVTSNDVRDAMEDVTLLAEFVTLHFL